VHQNLGRLLSLLQRSMQGKLGSDKT